jgi:hypothetical protein
MSNDHQHYREQVAAFRYQKQQEDLAVDYNQAVYGREESLRNRQEIERQAAVEIDPDERARLKDEWHYYDAEVQRCEADIQRLAPPPPPHPKVANLAQRNTPFFRQYGQRGAQVADVAHRYVTERMGVTPDDPRYEEMVKSWMELHAKNYNCPYDPNSEMLTPDEAAKISGLSPKAYNSASRRMAADGRFSWQNRK